MARPMEPRTQKMAPRTIKMMLEEYSQNKNLLVSYDEEAMGLF